MLLFKLKLGEYISDVGWATKTNRVNRILSSAVLYLKDDANGKRSYWFLVKLHGQTTSQKDHAEFSVP